MASRTTVTCGECGDAFETRPNWLAEHATCPDCFAFPDVHPNEPVDDRFDVYLVARIQHIPKSGIESNYYRVAARTAYEAQWFTEAYSVLSYQYRDEASNRKRLASLTIDDSGIANTNTHPLLIANELSGEWHDGYAVRELAFRGTHADADRQRDLGPNTTDQFTHMAADDYQDVLVHATGEQIEHKLTANVPDDHLCYWTVSGTPRRTRFGQRIWFENDGRIVASGPIHGVEAGRIWFRPLERVDREPPTDPPTRGFTYIEPLERVEEARTDGGGD